MQASKLQPALLGGTVAGVLSALPIVNAANLCCCLWVVTGGVVAAYLLQQNQRAPLTAGDAALVGLYAGLIGAVISTILTIPISLMVGPIERQVLERLAEQTGQEFPMPLEGGLSAVYYLALGCVSLFVGAIFSTLGGLLGATLFRRPAQPDIIDIPPAPPI